jgi:hypothetical protein
LDEVENEDQEEEVKESINQHDEFFDSYFNLEEGITR